MYHPPSRSDGRNLEFVELYNSEPFPANISGYRLSGDVDYVFPTNTTVPGRGFIVVAAVPSDIQSIYGLAGVLGGLPNPTNSLPNDSGIIRLRNKADAVLVGIDYSDDPPWPPAADGAGHSLVLARPSLGERNPAAWAPSVFSGGSPGVAEPADTDPLSAVVINEFLAHTDDPELDYIELYNHSNQPLDLSGCILTDDPLTNRFVFPPDTFIPAGGFLSYKQTNLNFSLSAEGETIYLRNAAQTRVIDAVRFGAQENGVSTGRFPDGSVEFYRLSAKTPGAANSPIRVSQVVINELMYHPITEDSDDEYVELYNRGPGAVNLAGWQLAEGIRFTFDGNVVIAPGAYLVVARNAARLSTNYPNLSTNNTFGDFEGNLSDRGETVALTMPDTVVSTNISGIVETNLIHITVDEVNYGTGGRWGPWSDGGGSSLELIDAQSDHQLASNWADSDETAKAPWTPIEATGVLDNGNTGFPMNNLQAILQDAGECLLDNVEVISTGGTNRIANWDFESGMNGWVAQGNHELSSLELTGYGGSSRSLHLRATSNGDTGANRVRTALISSLSNGQTATFRAQARWLRGRPEILLRVHGNQHEAPGLLAVPRNLGTPGAPNSRAAANAAPAIYAVTHSPALPAANQQVVVAARVHDPDGPVAVFLKYRKDPTVTLTTISMLDTGTAGDAVSGDGIYSAIIPGQTNGSLIAFHVQATDNFVPAATATFPAAAPVRECLVRFGESVPANAFGTYRIWMTQATFNKWTSRPRLSNDPLDVTFVYGNSRVVYNVGAQYAGSPYHAPGYSTPTGNPCDYALTFPKDDLWLGETDVHISWPGNGGDDSTGQREQTAYWVAAQLGLPFNNRRFINLYVNGIRRNYIVEDTQRANSDVLEQWYPDDANGDLHKIAGWFEFDDPTTSFNTVWSTLQNFTTTDLTTGQRVKDVGRYRWNWQKRALQTTANDFANLFTLVDVANTTGPAYVEQMEKFVDVEHWMRTFAVEHLVGNWDSYGNRNGQNMYAYKPQHGTWKLFIWDLDIALGGISDPPTSSLFAVSDTVIGRMYNTPAFRRIYWRAMRDAVNGPLNPTNANPVLDAKYAVFQANAISATSPSGIKSYITSRRNYVINQLNAVAAGFTITSNGGQNFSTGTNLLTLAGTAPIEAATLKVNGVAFRPAWSTITNWTMTLALKDGVNHLIVQGFDAQGILLANATAAITVTLTGSNDFPTDHLVINEIMYNPATPNAAFIEVHNTSATTAFDLSGWRLDGADFSFTDGAIIPPGGFAVVANDRFVFSSAYGRFIPVAGELKGQLDNSGERLRLIKPGATPAEELVIDEVTYGNALPWPPLADGSGPSLQLIDPAQDNSRVANWNAVNTNLTPALPAHTPGTTNSVFVASTALPAVWLNELQPNNVSGIADRFGEREPWVEIYNGGPDTVGLSGFYLSDTFAELMRWPFPAGTTVGAGQSLLVWLDGEAGETTAGELHTGFRLPPDTGSLALVKVINGQPAVIDYLTYDLIPADRSYGSFPDGQAAERQILHYPTPGATNDPSPGPLAILINEWMAANASTLADPADGNFDDWFELYNPNSAAIDLSGYTLTDNFTNATRWAIPAGTLIAPHAFVLVWSDEDTHQNNPTNTDLHADFKLSQDGEEIALFAPDGRLVDHVRFADQTDDLSEGRWPDGGGDFFIMTTPTPRTPNFLPADPPPEVRIIETAASPGVFFALSWEAEPGKA
ncbi:MAG TPA: lamin tail domain-containing protein, partial [Verrucomicrobiae bacterium]|nr:lamin tail domain-containing protein [Verrucomicrobiae bacterium]